MNILEMLVRVEQLTDRTRSARFKDVDKINAINDAILRIVKDRVAPIKVARKYSIQSVQRVKDELYTLIPDAVTGATVSGSVPYPDDYFYYLLLYVTINGVRQRARPTTYNELSVLEINPFKKPTVVKPYYNEFVDGLRLHYGGT